MWVKSEATSHSEDQGWLVGLFRIDDFQTSAPSQKWVIQGIQGWTDIQVGCPQEGCKVGVIPDAWAFGWMSPDKKVIDVHPDAQNILITCGSDGCPTPQPHARGSIALTASKDRD
jgi:hypothetical protein